MFLRTFRTRLLLGFGSVYTGLVPQAFLGLIRIVLLYDTTLRFLTTTHYTHNSLYLIYPSVLHLILSGFLHLPFEYTAITRIPYLFTHFASFTHDVIVTHSSELQATFPA
jgi:hypothetical protein